MVFERQGIQIFEKVFGAKNNGGNLGRGGKVGVQARREDVKSVSMKESKK